MTRQVPIGVVMGTHGVRGELRVKIYNAESQLLRSLRKLSLKQGAATTEHELRSARPANKGWLVQLRNVDSVESAKALQGAEICVSRDALPALAPGEFYFADLEGLRAVARDGTALGTALGVHEYPASSVLRVDTGGSLVEVPMIAPYLVAVQVAEGYVVLDHLDDLEVEKPRR